MCVSVVAGLLGVSSYLWLFILPILGTFYGIEAVLRLSLLLCLQTIASSVVPASLVSTFSKVFSYRSVKRNRSRSITLLPPATKLRQDNVFIPVRDSVHREGVSIRETPLDRDPPGQRSPRDRDAPWTETPRTETIPGQRPPRQRPLLDRDSPGQRPPPRDRDLVRGRYREQIES